MIERFDIAGYGKSDLQVVTLQIHQYERTVGPGLSSPVYRPVVPVAAQSETARKTQIALYRGVHLRYADRTLRRFLG